MLGKSFTAAALRHHQPPGADASTRARGLVDKDLLAIQSDPRSPERGQYVFVQDLVRSVAYGTLARRDRKLRHLAAAAYLESSWSEDEEIAEVVAAHLVEAYDADPDAADAGEIRDRATQGPIRAGEHASSLRAAASAQLYFEQALALVRDEAWRAELHLKAGKAATRRVEARRPGSTSARPPTSTPPLVRHSTTRPRSPSSPWWSCRRGTIRRHPAPAGISILAGVEAEEYRCRGARSKRALGRMLFFIDDLEAALPHIERGLQIAEHTGSGDLLARALDTKAMILAVEGRPREAEILLRGALSAALDNDLPERAASTCASLATLLEGEDRMEDALAVYEQGQELGERLGDRKMMWGAEAEPDGRPYRVGPLGCVPLDIRGVRRERRRRAAGSSASLRRPPWPRCGCIFGTATWRRHAVLWRR